LSYNIQTFGPVPVGSYGTPVALIPAETTMQQGGNMMKVKFVLTMDDVVVNGQKIDQIVMDWETEVDQQEILEVSHQWITTQNFLTKRMVGLTRVGESSLTIEPLEGE
jgi:hypothetical protein